jgi:SSS family solute:Na+ symporter
MTHFSPWIDGSIVGVYLLITMAAGVFVKKYVGKVDDFLVAGREMDVFLGIASLAATEFGIVTCMYEAEFCYKYGFSGAIPGISQAVAMLLIGLTGFCIKPLRDSGVLTIPELLDRRFGPRVRWAAGVVIVLGGLLNMGVFLRVGGEFLVLVCGLQKSFPLEWMMTILLVMVAVYTILGGMLSVLVTDFLQFVVMSVGLIVVTILILHQIGWETLAKTVADKNGAGGFNPLVHPALGWPYIIFQFLLNGAATLTWQTTIARVLSAKDTVTGQKVYTRTSFFFVCRSLMPGIWGIAALAFFLRPGATPPENPLHAMPLFLGSFVPIGLMGLLIAAMLAADMSTDSSYMLTWGSVIYNDLMAPFHRGRWSDKTGLMVNRFIVAGIGVFLLIYGLWYQVKGNVWDYLTVTGSIYLASMSTLLIACCYWSRANNWGAIAAIIVGAFFPAGYLVLQQVAPQQADQIGPYYSGIAAYVGAALAMIIGSLLKNVVQPEAAQTRPISEQLR